MLSIPGHVQSNTSPPVTTDCGTSENCEVTLFTRGSAVPLLMGIPPMSSWAALVYELGGGGGGFSAVG